MTEPKDVLADNPFQRLRVHAESRKKMTKAQLLADAEMADEAYINMASEKDMAEAYYKDLEAAEYARLAAAPSLISPEGLRERMVEDLAERLHAQNIACLGMPLCPGPPEYHMVHAEAILVDGAMFAASPVPDPGAGLREAAQAVVDSVHGVQYGTSTPRLPVTAESPVHWRVSGAAIDALRAALAPSAETCEHDWQRWLANTSQCQRCGARRDDLALAPSAEPPGDGTRARASAPDRDAPRAGECRCCSTRQALPLRSVHSRLIWRGRLWSLWSRLRSGGTRTPGGGSGLRACGSLRSVVPRMRGMGTGERYSRRQSYPGSAPMTWVVVPKFTPAGARLAASPAPDPGAGLADIDQFTAVLIRTFSEAGWAVYRETGAPWVDRRLVAATLYAALAQPDGES